MTRLMEQAIEQLRSVPENEQDRLALFLLQALEDERWIQSTAAHEDKLAALVGSVLAHDVQGKCQPLEPDQL